MLSRPANRKADDIRATRFVPLVKHSIAARNEQLEIVRRKGNLAIDPFGAKKYKPAAQFNVRHFLSKEALAHELPSPCPKTEQLGNRQRLLAESNKQFINLFGFRRTASNERRAA